MIRFLFLTRPKIVNGNSNFIRRKHGINNLSSKTRRWIIKFEKKDIDDTFNKIINESNYLLLGIISDVSLIDSRNTFNIICSKQLKTIPTKGLFY